MFIIRNSLSASAVLEHVDSQEQLSQITPGDQDYKITSAADLLRLYMETEDSSPLTPLLKEAREHYLDDLDQVEGAAEVTGLMVWLLADQGIDNRGETLEATADRLGDMDIDADSDQYTDLIFHLKDAVERLYDLEL
ncbi:MAG: hypothetical protein ACPGF7_15075 [Pontibacterium sp.]